jgi:hypothetical protein
VVFLLSEFKEIVELFFWRDFSSFFSRKVESLIGFGRKRQNFVDILSSLLASRPPCDLTSKRQESHNGGKNSTLHFVEAESALKHVVLFML